MGKTAFIFPGQGAQYCGMGKDFYEKYEVARKVYELAGKATGMDVCELCFSENDRLNITEYTQIAMLTTEVAILETLMEQGLSCDVAAGLSLGEYGALAVAGVMKMEDLFTIIRKRGIFMQEAYPVGGAMTAVLGMDEKQIEEICGEVDGIVSVANYNCPGQIVITGEKEAVDQAARRLKEAGARKCIPLNVSGPFHSALLSDAGKKLLTELEKVELRAPKVPYVCNVEADYVTEEDREDRIRELLAKQIESSVRWQQSVERMIQDGVDTFVEIGPGKTLTGFMRKINRDVTIKNVETVQDMENMLEALKG